MTQFEKILDEAGIYNIDQNDIMRTLNYHKWTEFDTALATIKEGQAWKRQYHVKQGNEHLIPYEMGSHALEVQGKDRIGRSTIIMRPGLYHPECSSYEGFNTYSGL